MIASTFYRFKSSPFLARQNFALPFLGVASIVLSLQGCKSQLDGKQQAEVHEAAPKPAQEPAAEPAQGGDAASVRELAIATDKSEVGFVGAKVTADHPGSFSKFSGTCKLDGDKPVGLSVEIDTDSLTADSDRLTGHLKSPDFFDVANFPKASFVATGFETVAGQAEHYKVTGDLDLHGVKKSVSFDATITQQETAFVGAAEFKINRKDFQIVYAGKPDDLIKDEVLLKLKLVCSS